MEIVMKKHAHPIGTTHDEGLLAGIVKHLGNTETAVIGAKTYTGADLTAFFKARIDLLNLVAKTHQDWRNAVAQKNAKMTETSDLVLAIEQYFRLRFGQDTAALADFGLAPRQRKAPNVATKYVATKKAEATRAARNPSATPTPTHPPTPPKPTTNGASTPNA
jgi:hypothetical protein